MKKLFKLAINGCSLGISIGFTIALVFSLIFQSKNFEPSTPEFVNQFSSNISATFISLIIWALMGIVFSISSLIFRIESWGLNKKTIVHFVITYFGYSTLVFLTKWFPMSFWFIFSYTLLFIIIYIFMWKISYNIARKKVKQINKLLNN
ncbi:DUF3021 domain-containing protein [Apilactobacillus micheneri]|uniref:DUF3021 domain-containing protein n=1 Tax=Apilactobacillus micheneri TaxID=1899430 RepID=UPI00112B0EB4|nr:DUF3021 domain-containing protein [Apilactobacillus micheneri]TPR43570.1 DUF3021 domain-containing protein [Apilactobacillus micheneri]TPR47520.1 DUF3021 domain-containing protein [Apilactobacillus micheneri]